MIPALTAIATILVLGQQAHQQFQAALQAEPMAETVAIEEQDVSEDLISVPENVETMPAIERAEEVVPPMPETPAELSTEIEPETAMVEIPNVLPSEETGLTERALPGLDPSVRADLLTRAEASLAASQTAKGGFEQLNADGTFVTGEFALRRPGRVRFDYTDPSPILIVSDGTTVAMQDTDLETVDRIPLGSTPLGLILDDDLDFSDDTIEIINVSEEIGLVSVTVRDATGEVGGELTLLFEAEGFDLLGWIATDAELQTTQVSLNNVETNTRLDPRLFRLDDPRDEEDER